MIQKELRPILVTGAHRSGTTWVGKTLSASKKYAYISEPLNVHHRPGVLREPVDYWYLYICQDNEAPYLNAFREMLGFHYHTGEELKSLRSWKDLARFGRDWWNFILASINGNSALMKDPFAVFSAAWFADRLNCQVVITVRHPAAFVNSLKRLDWSFQIEHLHAQPLLMRDWLKPFQDDIEIALSTRPNDIIGRSALLWKMIYTVVKSYQRDHPDFMIVRHEDLSREPITGYQRLFEQLGLQYTPDVQRTVIKSSDSSNPAERSNRAVHTTQLDSRANIDNWKNRLTDAEVSRIRTITGDVAAHFYSQDTWE
jgi:hypothetical protein